MKKHLLLAAFVCCIASANAQNPKGTFSIKPMAGINVTGLSGGIHDLYGYESKGQVFDSCCNIIRMCHVLKNRIET